MGKVNPSSKFPFSYPRSTGDFDVYYHKPWGYYSQVYLLILFLKKDY